MSDERQRGGMFPPDDMAGVQVDAPMGMRWITAKDQLFHLAPTEAPVSLCEQYDLCDFSSGEIVWAPKRVCKRCCDAAEQEAP